MAKNLWLQDNENILFQGVRDIKDKKALEEGDEFSQFYKININGGEAEKVFRIPIIVNSIYELDKDNFLFTSTNRVGRKDLSILTKDEKENELKLKKEEKDYEILDEIPFWSNGSGFTNKKRMGLYLYNLSTKEITLITDEYTSVMGLELNEKRNKVVFTASSYKDKAPLNDELYIYDIISKELTLLNKDEVFSYGCINFMNDDTLIVTGSNMKEYGINEDARFYLINLNTTCCSKIIIAPNTGRIQVFDFALQGYKYQ